ncbi:hypothetical protein EBU94_05415 [bacterium]|nr:hypothetical protein [bacterium]
MNQLSDVIGGTGAGVYAASTPNLQIGEFHVSVLRLQDLTKSIAPQMSQNPDLFYLYPFIYSQSFSTTPFTGRVDPNRVLINLTGFQQGILTSILFHVVRQDDITGAVANGAKNGVSVGQRLRNLRLSFNSQTLSDKPGISADELLTLTSLNPNYWPASSLNTSTTTSPFPSAPVNSYFYEVKFSPLNISPKEIESSLLGGLENVSNITLQLEFSTPDASQYQIFAIYNYDASVKVQGGQCTYIF